MELEKINPDFSDLKNPETIQKHLEVLKSTCTQTLVPHVEIIDKLKNEFEELDFVALAFPQVEKLRDIIEKNPVGSDEYDEAQKQIERLKLNTKHYLIIAIENTLKIANDNKWGICKNQESIYLYNGNFWKEIEKEVFQNFLGESAEKMGVSKYNARFHIFRDQLFKQFMSIAYLPKPESKKDSVLLNMRNGTIEVTQDGAKLNDFEKSDFLTYQLPFNYDPKATAPIFQKYLNDVLPDLDSQKVLAEYLGFVFIKHGSNILKEEKALILYGSGANGKSVFFEIVTALFGKENLSNYSLQSLTEEKGFYRARIANKLINYASEINGKLEASLFKAMVSGEPVEACLKYGQPFTMENYAKFIFNCNELPKDVEHTNAYFRRFLIIPFLVTIPEHKQDKNLHTKIIENELSGVFNWVLDGLNRLLKQKRFSECEAAKKAVEKYKLESDSVQMFLDENEYTKSVVTEIPLKNIFSEYRTYCYESGFKACSLRTLSDRLRNLGYLIERKKYGMAVFAEKK